jgi:hypothetical protein
MAYGRRDEDDDDEEEEVGVPPLAFTADTTSDALVRVMDGGSCRSGNSFDMYFSTFPFDVSSYDIGGDDVGCCAWTENDLRIVAVAVAVAVAVDG